MISFDCTCGKPFRFSPKFVGRSFRCNLCGRPLAVPAESVSPEGQAVRTTVLSPEISDLEIIKPVKQTLEIDPVRLAKIRKNGKNETTGDTPPPIPPNPSPSPPPKRKDAKKSNISDAYFVILPESDSMESESMESESMESDFGGGASDSISTVLSKAAISAHASHPEEPILPNLSENTEPVDPSFGFENETSLTEIPPTVLSESPAEPVLVPKTKGKAKKQPVPAAASDSVSPDSEAAPALKPKKKHSLPSFSGGILLKTVFVLLVLSMIGALAGLYLQERGKTAAEKENTQRMQNQINQLQRQLNESKETQTTVLAEETAPVSEPPPIPEQIPISEPIPTPEPAPEAVPEPDAAPDIEPQAS